MSDITINPIKKIEGEICLGGDKSISHRAIMIASIAKGRSLIKNFLKSEDCLYTVKAFQGLGIPIKFSGIDVTVEGNGPRGLSLPRNKIYLGNSGTSMRIIPGILAGQDFETTLTGDESLSKRPMDRVIEPLRKMGADIKGRDDKYAPLVIKGRPLKAISYKTGVASAQVKSAIMLAALYADGITEVEEPAKSRDHTERMLSLFGTRLRVDGLKVSIYGGSLLKAAALTVPGDISAAAFFITAALLVKDSWIRIKDLLYNRTRLGFVDVLKEMGGEVNIANKRFNGFEEICDIEARSSS